MLIHVSVTGFERIQSLPQPPRSHGPSSDSASPERGASSRVVSWPPPAFFGPDPIWCALLKEITKYLQRSKPGRDAVSSKWRSRGLGGRAGHVLGDVRFLDLTIDREVNDTFHRVSLPGSASAISASSPLAEDIVFSL